MSDILFKHESGVFSYRVAGILLRDNKILLQKPTNDTGYAVPGGHVRFGETNAQTLEREFMDSLGQFEVYPTNITDLMQCYTEGVQHFVYREVE
jgi:ADP-ribose pyrophosphatase YjhB (NUDIX family)